MLSSRFLHTHSHYIFTFITTNQWDVDGFLTRGKEEKIVLSGPFISISFKCAGQVEALLNLPRVFGSLLTRIQCTG